VITAGGLWNERGFGADPLVAQPVQLSWANVQPLGGGQRVKCSRIKGGEDFLDIDRWNTMGELFFCIEAE